MSTDARKTAPPEAHPVTAVSRIWQGVNLDARRLNTANRPRLLRRLRGVFEASSATVLEFRADGSLVVLSAGCETAAIALGFGAHDGSTPWTVANDNAIPDSVRRAVEAALGDRAPARMSAVLLGVDHELSVVPSGDGEALCVLRESPFAPTAAHDLNNCLTAIGCAAGGLLDDPLSTESTRSAVTEILEALRRAEAMTRQMLARGRARHTHLDTLDLGQELLALTASLRRSLPDAVRFVAEIDPDMPCARLRSGHLQRVLMNLASNATHALEGRGTITLSAWGESSPEAGGVVDRAVIEVLDDGRGMPPEVLARVFEAWFSTRAEGEGHGLGLASVRALVQEAGGTVAIDSREGVGTRVTVTLPAYSPRVSAAVDAPPINERE